MFQRLAGMFSLSLSPSLSLSLSLSRSINLALSVSERSPKRNDSELSDKMAVERVACRVFALVLFGQSRSVTQISATRSVTCQSEPETRRCIEGLRA